jgi:hypothetical protein
VTIDPGLPIALLVGLACTAAYVLARGNVGSRLPIVFAAAVLGAWAGAWLGAKVGIRFLAIGDFPLLPAVITAGLGIGIVAILATLGPGGRESRP